MNLLFIESSIDPSRGGIQRVSYSLFEYFESHGISCYFAYYLVGYDKIAEERKLFFDTNHNENKLLTTFAEFVSKNTIDIIILQGIRSQKILSVMKALKTRYGCKLIYCLHLTPDYYLYVKDSNRPKSFFLRVLTGKSSAQRGELNAYKASDRYIVLSKSYVPYFCDLYKLPVTQKINYIMNPMPFGRITAALPKENSVLIVTRFSEVQKNLKAALRIWKGIENLVVKENWILKIAGYGDDETMLINYASKLGLKNFQFIGKSNNPISLYEKSSLFMMTSFFEGLPMTLLECMSMGCVPVAFDSFKSLSDIINDGENGFIIPAFDENKFANMLSLLIRDPFLRNNMKNAAIIASESFSINNIGQRWIGLFHELQHSDV